MIIVIIFEKRTAYWPLSERKKTKLYANINDIHNIQCMSYTYSELYHTEPFDELTHCKAVGLTMSHIRLKIKENFGPLEIITKNCN